MTAGSVRIYVQLAPATTDGERCMAAVTVDLFLPRWMPGTLEDIRVLALELAIERLRSGVNA